VLRQQLLLLIGAMRVGHGVKKEKTEAERVVLVATATPAAARRCASLGPDISLLASHLLSSHLRSTSALHT
jgi:hypothetical protein